MSVQTQINVQNRHFKLIIERLILVSLVGLWYYITRTTAAARCPLPNLA